MQGLLNAMRLQALRAGEAKVVTMLGIVHGYNPNNYTAKVELQPDGTMTGFLPVASPWVGNGWGLFMPPTDGDVVEVTFQEGDLSSGIIGLRLFTDSARPANVPSGEFQLIHKSGSSLKFHNDGTVEFISSGLLTIKAANIYLQNAGSALKKLVNETFMTLFNNHVHPAGTPNTGVPTVQMTATNLTATVQAE